jgi:hypothetical protein
MGDLVIWGFADLGDVGSVSFLDLDFGIWGFVGLGV